MRLFLPFWLHLFVASASMMALSSSAASTGPSLYGLLDTAFVREWGGITGARTLVASGVGAQSRIGVRGGEALANGMEVSYVLETGLSIETGALAPPGNLLFGRAATLSVSSTAGTISAGRFMTPYYEVLSASDPFETGMAGSASNLMASSGIRMSNTWRYTSPSLAGLVVKLAAATGNAGNATAVDAHGASMVYLGPQFSVRLAHHSRRANPAVPGHAANTIIGATYSGTAAKWFAAAVRNRGIGSAPLGLANPYGSVLPPQASPASNDYLLGLSIALAHGKIDLSYVRKDDRTSLNADSAQLALGYVYSLSTRSSLYAAVAAIRNQNSAAYTVGNQSGEPGSGNRAWNAGVRHVF